MKLSDFKGDEAIEVLADIMEPAVAIITDPEIRKMSEDSNRWQIAMYMLKEHKDSILDMYEPLTRESREEATIPKLARLAMDIVFDKELTSLFSSQSQDGALKSSGSATENTEDGLK